MFKLEPNKYNTSIANEGDETENKDKKKKKTKKKDDPNTPDEKRRGGRNNQNQADPNINLDKGLPNDKEAAIKKAVTPFKQGNFQGPNKQAHQALEAIIQESGKNIMPLLSRGPEIELSTMKDMEGLRQHLAKHKIHIDPKVLQRAMVIPRD
jgi:hypothetical protein